MKMQVCASPNRKKSKYINMRKYYYLINNNKYRLFKEGKIWFINTKI